MTMPQSESQARSADPRARIGQIEDVVIEAEALVQALDALHSMTGQSNAVGQIICELGRKLEAMGPLFAPMAASPEPAGRIAPEGMTADDFLVELSTLCGLVNLAAKFAPNTKITTLRQVVAEANEVARRIDPMNAGGLFHMPESVPPAPPRPAGGTGRPAENAAAPDLAELLDKATILAGLIEAAENHADSIGKDGTALFACMTSARPLAEDLVRGLDRAGMGGAACVH